MKSHLDMPKFLLGGNSPSSVKNPLAYKIISTFTVQMLWCFVSSIVDSCICEVIAVFVDEAI